MDRLRNIGRMHTVVIWNVQVVCLQSEQVIDKFPRRNVERLDKIAFLCERIELIIRLKMALT